MADGHRFMRKGTAKFFFVESIASTSGPTVAEITAGIDLTPQIAEVAGFSFKNNPIKTPDMATDFVSQIGGEDDTVDSSITFYELTEGDDDIRDAMVKGTVGYVVIFSEGIAGDAPAAADVADVWPSIITSNAKQYTAANEAAKYQVSFALTDKPDIEVAVAA